MRATLYVLLAVVAGASAVSSFDALHTLAVQCAFGPTAPLLPLVIDAGAAAGTLAWLSCPAGASRSFGRVLALALLGLSVAGNALSHGLTSAAARPHWVVVVGVAAVAPAVLGAVAHLAMLVGRRGAGRVVDLARVSDEVRQVRSQVSEVRSQVRSEATPQVRQVRSEVSPQVNGGDHAGDLARQLRSWVAAQGGQVPSRREIRARFRISTDRAAALRAQVMPEPDLPDLVVAR